MKRWLLLPAAAGLCLWAFGTQILAGQLSVAGTVRVVHGKDAVPASRAELRALSGGREVAISLTDQAGRFAFYDLAPGTYTVVLRSPPLKEPVMVDVQVPVLLNVTLHEQAGRPADVQRSELRP